MFASVCLTFRLSGRGAPRRVPLRHHRCRVCQSPRYRHLSNDLHTVLNSSYGSSPRLSAAASPYPSSACYSGPSTPSLSATPRECCRRGCLPDALDGSPDSVKPGRRSCRSSRARSRARSGSRDCSRCKCFYLHILPNPRCVLLTRCARLVSMMGMMIALWALVPGSPRRKD